jgi:hypothetical protein
MTALPCLRCGYCCRKAPCLAAKRGSVRPLEACPHLRGERPGQYACGLYLEGKYSAEYLCIGAGCSSSLNSDRRALARELGLPEFSSDRMERSSMEET